MIKVHGVVTWSGAGAPRFARLGGRHRFETPVRSVERSVRFYQRVFGFDATVHSEAESASVTLAPHIELVLDASVSAVQRYSVEPRWGLLVTDITAVRGEVWDLGVKVARDSGAPDHIYREENMWSLYVQDPDGNVILLVEARVGRAAPSSRLRPRSTTAGSGGWVRRRERSEPIMRHGDPR